MAICKYCKGRIEFRYVAGQCTPIHVGGGRCTGGGSSTSRPTTRRPSVYSHDREDFCRPTSCPHCHASVFFIRYNGGSVWVDQLGWPWPRHGCFNKFDANPSRRLFQHASLPTGRRWLIGRVSRVLLEGSASNCYTLLAIRAAQEKRFCVSLRGSYSHFPGQIIFVDCQEEGTVRSVIRADDGSGLPLLNARLDPRLLGLPSGWLSGEASRPSGLSQPGAMKLVLTVSCPRCSAQVREDRLERHLRRVHQAWF